MKTASRILYLVGRILNIVHIIGSVLFIIFGIVLLASKDSISAQAAIDGIEALDTIKKVEIAGINVIIISSFSLAFSIATFVLATFASKQIKLGNKAVAPHVIMLIIGFFGDIFYLVGGIFGICACQEKE